MKLGVIGDIHAEDRRLESAIAFMRTLAVDQILSVGDIVDGAGDVDRCCALLADSRVICVRGNHDRWLLEGTMRNLPEAHISANLAPASLAFLSALPTTRRLETSLGTLLLCHGVNENDMRQLGPRDDGYELECNDELQALLRSNEFAFVVGGHTHHRMVRRFGSMTVVNAGTLKRDNEPCFGILDFAANQAEFYDIADPDAVLFVDAFALETSMETRPRT